MSLVVNCSVESEQTNCSCCVNCLLFVCLFAHSREHKTLKEQATCFSCFQPYFSHGLLHCQYEQCFKVKCMYIGRYEADIRFVIWALQPKILMISMWESTVAFFCEVHSGAPCICCFISLSMIKSKLDNGLCTNCGYQY